MRLQTDDTTRTPLEHSTEPAATDGPPWTAEGEADIDGGFPIEGDAGSANGDGKAQISGGSTTPPPPTAG
jgi:hypothetical protein